MFAQLKAVLSPFSSFSDDEMLTFAGGKPSFTEHSAFRKIAFQECCGSFAFIVSVFFFVCVLVCVCA